MSTGSLEEDNPSDCLEFEVALVQTDRLYTAKRGILEAMGYSMNESFPIYKNKMPLQLLSYHRLARVTDAAELTKVGSFKILDCGELRYCLSRITLRNSRNLPGPVR